MRTAGPAVWAMRSAERNKRHPMFTSINPATGEPGRSFAELPDAQPAARRPKPQAPSPAWRNSPLADRMTLLRHIAERFEDDKDRLARIATEEMGKTLK